MVVFGSETSSQRRPWQDWQPNTVGGDWRRSAYEDDRSQQPDDHNALEYVDPKVTNCFDVAFHGLVGRATSFTQVRFIYKECVRFCIRLFQAAGGRLNPVNFRQFERALRETWDTEAVSWGEPATQSSFSSSWSSWASSSSPPWSNSSSSSSYLLPL